MIVKRNLPMEKVEEITISKIAMHTDSEEFGPKGKLFILTDVTKVLRIIMAS